MNFNCLNTCIFNEVVKLRTENIDVGIKYFFLLLSNILFNVRLRSYRLRFRKSLILKFKDIYFLMHLKTFNIS